MAFSTFNSIHSFVTKININNIPLPSVPSNLYLISTTAYTADISFSMADLSYAVTYSVILSPSANVIVTTDNNLVLDISGLSPNTTYNVNIVASNSTGSSISSVLSFTTSAYSTLIPGIVGRYTTSLWLDASSSTNFALSGSNVTTWIDKTTNGFNLTNNGTITYNSSSPSSVLIPSGTYFSNPSFNTLTSLQTWIFVVSFPSASTTTDCRIICLSNFSYGGIDILAQDSKLYIYHHRTGGASGNGIKYDLSLSVNAKYLISISFNMSTSYSASLANSIIRINGITQSGIVVISDGTYSAYSTVGTSQYLLIGVLSDTLNNYASNQGFNIYEMIGINNQNLGSNDVKTIENYLNIKWNLGLTIGN